MSVLLFILGGLAVGCIVVVGSFIWLRTAQWPEWFLAMWIQEPAIKGLSGVQQIVDWIWMQPLLEVAVTTGFVGGAIVAIIGWCTIALMEH